MEYSKIDLSNAIEGCSEKQTSHIDFMNTLTHSSLNCEYLLSIHEWYLYYSSHEEYGNCICNKNIKNLYYIKNKINGNLLLVGSSCIKKIADCDVKTEILKIKKQKDSIIAKKRYQDNSPIREFKKELDLIFRESCEKVEEEYYYNKKKMKLLFDKLKITVIKSGKNTGRTYFEMMQNSQKTIIWICENTDTPNNLYLQMYDLIMNKKLIKK